MIDVLKNIRSMDKEDGKLTLQQALMPPTQGINNILP